MPKILNKVSNPIGLCGVVIQRGETVTIDDGAWKEWNKNPSARRLADATLEIIDPSPWVAFERFIKQGSW